MIIQEMRKLDDGVSPSVHWKLFRQKEYEAKIDFIIAHSDVDISLIVLSNNLSQANEYHNFDHQIGVAESAIRFAEAEGLSRKEINLLVVAALFHDAGHTGVAKIDDEENAAALATTHISPEVFEKLGFTHEQLTALILSTIFSQRGQYNSPVMRILQDADISGVFFGPYYRLYACMGLAYEFGGDYQKFIHQDQQAFVNYLESICPGGLLSDGAKKVGGNLQSSLDIILSRPDEVIDYAYQVRHDDILFVDYQKHIDELIQKHK